MPSLSLAEIFMLFATVVLLFGSIQLPRLARSAGQPRRDFLPGPASSTPDTSEPVGLTLRQIQFRGARRADSDQSGSSL